MLEVQLVELGCGISGIVSWSVTQETVERLLWERRLGGGSRRLSCSGMRRETSSSLLRGSRLSWLGWSTPGRDRTTTRDILSLELDGIDVHRVSIAFWKGWLPVVVLLSSIEVEGEHIPSVLLLLIDLLLISNQSVDSVVIGVGGQVGHQEASSDERGCVLLEVQKGHILVNSCLVSVSFKGIAKGFPVVVFTLLALGHLVEVVLLRVGEAEAFEELCLEAIPVVILILAIDSIGNSSFHKLGPSGTSGVFLQQGEGNEDAILGELGGFWFGSKVGFEANHKGLSICLLSSEV